MAEGQEAQAQNPPTTIWNQLDVWAQGFKPWQRFVLAHAVRFGRLTDEQIDQAYSLFLHDNNLGKAPDPPVEVPAAITGRPASAAPAPIWLKRIGDLRAINALPAAAELTFSPALTVVYGGNGVGKSGFTRILSNVCFSRTEHPILPNVYDEQSKDEPAASIVTADGAQKETPFVFDGSTEYPELKRIAVFDTAVARTHLVEQSPLGFKPAGFDVFPEMARVYSQIANRLTAEIERRSRENTFTNSFVAPESPVSHFVAALSGDTDVAELRRLAVFGETETARLEEVQRQIKDLQSKSVAEAIKQLEDAKRDIAALQKRLTESGTLLTEEKRTGYPEPTAGAFNIGVLHTGLGGMGGHANYAPCTIDDLVTKGYDYWALGHVHQANVLHERPHVVFPGNLQGRHIRETGPKGAYLVTVEDGELTELLPIPADVVRWSLLSVDVETCTQTVDVVDRVRTAVEDAVTRDSDGRLLACRIELTGQTEIHDGLLVSTDYLLAEARAAALALGEEAAWVERVVIATTPKIDPVTLRAREDALGELQRMLNDATADASLLEQLGADLGELVRKMPHELRADAEDAVLKAAVTGDYSGLIGKVVEYLVARLAAEGQ